MKKDVRLTAALCANALIVLFELIALVLSLIDQGLESFFYYTQDSNYLAMAASLCFCVYGVKQLRGNGEMPRWIHSFRYVAVSCLMVTFFIVILVLMPMMGENALSMLYGGSMLYQHTLCPILAAVSFFTLEPAGPIPKRAILKALIPTLVYALVTIVLNLCRVIEGPYPFLMLYTQPWYASAMWCVVILGIAGLLAAGVLALHNRIVKTQSRAYDPMIRTRQTDISAKGGSAHAGHPAPGICLPLVLF